MRLSIATALLLASPATGYTLYNNQAAWEAAVGAYQVEDFESYPEMRLPLNGGSLELDQFSILNGDQGDNNYSGLSGLYLSSSWDRREFGYEAPAETTMSLIFSTETGDIALGGGPHWIEAVFNEPIWAYALDFAWCEDNGENYPPYVNDCEFLGVVLDKPKWWFSLARSDYGSYDPPLESLRICEHSWCAVEAILWAPVPTQVPEPSTGLLVLCGLIALRARKA